MAQIWNGEWVFCFLLFFFYFCKNCDCWDENEIVKLVMCICSLDLEHHFLYLSCLIHSCPTTHPKSHSYTPIPYYLFILLIFPFQNLTLFTLSPPLFIPLINFPFLLLTFQYFVSFYCINMRLFYVTTLTLFHVF